MIAAARTQVCTVISTSSKGTFAPQPHNIPAVFHYHNDLLSDDTPWKAPSSGNLQDTPGRKAVIPQGVTVTDVTPDIHQYTLETHGFQYVYLKSLEKDFLDEERIKAIYYPEVESLLKDSTGASGVYIFNHLVRRPAYGDEMTPTALPSFYVHSDQSYDGAVSVLYEFMADKAEDLAQKRFQIINVWKPIKTIHKDPFSVTDAQSIPDSDLLKVPVTLPSGRMGSGWSVRPNPDHRWYFKYQQTPEEVLLFKNFDSNPTGTAKRVMHSAFVDEEQVDKPARESLEVRALVFYD